MENQTVAFVGGGNMASAIVGGLLKSGWQSDLIRVSDPLKAQRDSLENDYGITCFEVNSQCIQDVDVIILATKPQKLREVIGSIREQVSLRKPTIISIAAGISIASITRWIGSPMPLIRVMPNTPALVNRGVSGLFANAQCSEEQKSLAGRIMQAVGQVVWVGQESDIDIVTGISGSGPAYFFKMMEIMIETAQTHGLDKDTATTLVLETAAGAAQLAINSADGPAALRRKVTSPAGTTEAALVTMESMGIDLTITKGIDAAIARSETLSDELGSASGSD